MKGILIGFQRRKLGNEVFSVVGGNQTTDWQREHTVCRCFRPFRPPLGRYIASFVPDTDKKVHFCKTYWIAKQEENRHNKGFNPLV